MMTLTATIEGNTTTDLEDAVREVLRLVSEDYRGGGNSNDTGSFNFDVTGEEEEEADEQIREAR